MFRFCTVILFGALFVHSISAHPHVWIDVYVRPETDENGLLSSLNFRWHFDPMFARLLLEKVEKASPDEKDDQWAVTEKSIIHYLSKQRFFMHNETGLSLPEAAQLTINEAGYLQLDYRYTLTNTQSSLQYRIYEPTYFIEMLHGEEQDKKWSNGCRLNLIPAEPGEDKIAEAYAIDITGTGDPNLGSYFSETATIECNEDK